MRPSRLIPCLLAALACVAFGLPASTPSAAAAGAEADGVRLLVKFRDGTTRTRYHSMHADAGTRIVGRMPELGIDVLEARESSLEQALARYRRRAEVEWAEPNVRYRALGIPNDPLFGGNGSSNDQWGLHNIGQQGGVVDADIDGPEGWTRAGGDSGSPWGTGSYAIGIVDTGIDAGHEDLQGKAITPCSSAVTGTGALTSGCGDDNGHGTHVAGIAVATANNGRGGAGSAFDARVYMCKALDFVGAGFSADIAACINDIVDKRSQHDIRVLSLSLGGTPSNAVRAAVDRAASAGLLVMAAAGNSGTPAVEFPAGYDSVMGVGATNRLDQKAAFSNFNSSVEVTAPGERIMSTSPGNRYQLLSGTSMSAPMAAGVAAMISSRTNRTGSALRQALRDSTDDLGSPGRDDLFGFGRVNLCKGLGGTNCANTTPPSPTPGPTPPGATPPGQTPGPSPTPAGEGTLQGRAVWLFGLPAWFVTISWTGPVSGSAISGLFGDFAARVPAGRYTVRANGIFFPCAAGGPGGAETMVVNVSANATSTVDFQC